MGRLPGSKREEITWRILSLAVKHREMGISTDSLAICHGCGHASPLAGSAQYGRYRLCNDCALKYELARAECKVESIEDFVLAD